MEFLSLFTANLVSLCNKPACAHKGDINGRSMELVSSLRGVSRKDNNTTTLCSKKESGEILGCENVMNQQQDDQRQATHADFYERFAAPLKQETCLPKTHNCDDANGQIRQQQ